MFDERLINKGRSVGQAELLSQANLSEALARLHEAELVPCGWHPDKSVLMEELQKQLMALVGEGEAQVEDARNQTRLEADARQFAKSLLRKIQEGLKILSREGGLGDLTLESFSRGGRNLQSTPALIDYLARVEPLVGKLDPALARFFAGHQPSTLVAEALDGLREADRAQEGARLELPAKTLERLELKGRLLDLIDELNGVARIAFDGQAERRAKFNKDLLLRGRRSKPADDPASPAGPIA
jgi:hypothetical protein